MRRIDVCVFCDEEIQPGQRAGACSSPAHYECLFRIVCGSVAHQEKRCACFIPGSEEGDPPGLSIREAGIAALNRHLEMQMMERFEAVPWP